MLGAALKWYQAGCSVIRVKVDGTKAPDGAWKEYQSRRVDLDTLISWFNTGYPGLGIVAGAVSGNLELLEFEGRAVEGGVLAEFGSRCAAAGIGDVWQRLAQGFGAQSPSGGLHVIYRVEGETIGGNVKLAERHAFDTEITPDEAERIAEAQAAGRELKPKRTLIETRGAGGFFVAAPSHGPVHPTGMPWQALGTGEPADMLTITWDERQALHAVARTLDELPAAPVIAYPERPHLAPVDENGLTPGEDFNRRASWGEILQPHGWSFVYESGGKQYWRRPGKRVGLSAMCGGDYGDYMTVFSTSTTLPDNKGLSKWRVYTILNFGDDDEAFKRAAGELRRAGFGGERPHLSAVPEGATLSVPQASGDGGQGLATVVPLRRSLASFLLGREGLESLPEPAPLVADTLDRGTVAMLAGYKGTFKSLTALDWAASLASGSKWQDRETERVRTLYVAAEGVLGLRNRIGAWEKSRAQRLLNDEFLTLRQAVNLGKDDEVRELGDIVAALGVGFVVIDTLNRCSVGLDENSAKDMGRVVESLYRILACTPQQSGCIVLIHHTGKDGKTVRGSSALEAGFDTVYTTMRDDDDDSLIHLRRTKRKDGEPDDSLRFKFHGVLGTDSGVLVQPGKFDPDGGVRRTSNADRIMWVFRESFYHVGGCTTRDLIEATGIPKRSVAHALGELVKAGRIVNTGTNQRPWWQLGAAEVPPS